MDLFKSNKILNDNNKELENIKSQHIFILAGGQLSNGYVNEWVKERLEISIKIAKQNSKSIIYCIGGGTYHKQPILNIYNHVIHESKSCSNYLIEKGFEPQRIRREWASYDTIANGFFSFTNFIIPLKIKDFVLVTSKFHMKRAKVIFDFFNKIFQLNIKIQYVVSENNMDNELLLLRTNRENKSTELFINNIVNNINTMQEFVDWFYIEHNAYNNINNIVKEKVNQKLKDSY
jgi:vancomycin permeability regulator SanA